MDLTSSGTLIRGMSKEHHRERGHREGEGDGCQLQGGDQTAHFQPPGAPPRRSLRATSFLLRKIFP